MFKKQKWFIILLTINDRKFRKCCSSLAENLGLKQLDAQTKFGIKSINSYYNKCNLNEKLEFSNIKSNNVFEIINILIKVRSQVSMIFQESF